MNLDLIIEVGQIQAAETAHDLKFSLIEKYAISLINGCNKRLVKKCKWYCFKKCFIGWRFIDVQFLWFQMSCHL